MMTLHCQLLLTMTLFLPDESVISILLSKIVAPEFIRNWPASFRLHFRDTISFDLLLLIFNILRGLKILIVNR